MKFSPVACCAILSAIAAFGGCNAPPSPNSASITPPQPSAAAQTRLNLGAGSGLSHIDLLYISDGNGEVIVYRYWGRSLVGVLTNFQKPLGMCVDAKQNVFITDYSAQQIVAYAHGATQPFRTISDAPYSPYDCSIDPVTGNLAVANAGVSSSSPGNVAIFPNASGSPTYYTDQRISNFQSCVFDESGNLLVTNGNLSRSSLFAWLPPGGSKLIDINVPGPEPSYDWRDVQGLQWDGKYFVIEDYDALYRVALLKGQAYYVGSTGVEIEGPSLYWIYKPYQKRQGTQVVGASNFFSSGEVEYYLYPAGGSAIHSISHGIDAPYGVAVSLKKR